MNHIRPGGIGKLSERQQIPPISFPIWIMKLHTKSLTHRPHIQARTHSKYLSITQTHTHIHTHTFHSPPQLDRLVYLHALDLQGNRSSLRPHPLKSKEGAEGAYCFLNKEPIECHCTQWDKEKGAGGEKRWEDAKMRGERNGEWVCVWLAVMRPGRCRPGSFVSKVGVCVCWCFAEMNEKGGSDILVL